MNVHENILCFMVMGSSLVQRLAVGSWRLALVAVGGGWQRLAIGGWRSLGAVPKGCPSPKKQKIWVPRDSPGKDTRMARRNKVPCLLPSFFFVGFQAGFCLATLGGGGG